MAEIHFDLIQDGRRRAKLEMIRSQWHRTLYLPNRWEAPVKNTSDVWSYRLARKNRLTHFAHRFPNIYGGVMIKGAKFVFDFSTPVTLSCLHLECRNGIGNLKRFLGELMTEICPPQIWCSSIHLTQRFGEIYWIINSAINCV